ncbi:excisionase family DNA-binding protein [soil metagenome]
MKRPHSDDAGSEYVSTAQVAKALGVGVTTVKRWVDEELIPARRTAGGHRKLHLADVVRWVQTANLPEADLSQLLPKRGKGLTAGDTESTLKQFVRAVRDLDTVAVRGVVIGAYRAGMPMETIADRVIAPGMKQLDTLCEQGKADIAHEHRVSQTCVSVLHELESSLRSPSQQDRPVAIGGAPEDDHNSLPSLLAKLVLTAHGWNAIDLGPHTPVSAFTSAIETLQTKLVWVSVSHLPSPSPFLRDYPAFFVRAQSRGIAVALGGRALTETIRSQLPYTTFGDGFSHLAAFANTLHPRPQRPTRGRPRNQ